jgi:hypothetical protein
VKCIIQSSSIIAIIASAYFMSACSPVKMSASDLASSENAATAVAPDGPTDGTTTTPTIPTLPPTVDVNSPPPTDPTSAANRCAQLTAQRPPLTSTNYGDIAGGVINETLIGNSVTNIIAAIGNIEAYFNTIGEAHTGASNVLLSANTIGDVSAGFGSVYLVDGSNETQGSVHSVVAGAPASVIVCSMHVGSIAMGVGNVVLVNSTVDELIGAAITVVEVNSTVTKSTVGLLTVKK